MCWVAAIPFIAMGVSALATASQQRQAGEATAAANLQNAAFAEQAALDATRRGEFESDQSRIANRELIGAQRAGFAANGVDVNSGSAANLQDDAAALGELDALTIRNNAAREAWGYRTQSAQNVMAAQNARASARSAVTGTLLSAGARAYGGYASMGR